MHLSINDVADWQRESSSTGPAVTNYWMDRHATNVVDNTVTS